MDKSNYQLKLMQGDDFVILCTGTKATCDAMKNWYLAHKKFFNGEFIVEASDSIIKTIKELALAINRFEEIVAVTPPYSLGEDMWQQTLLTEFYNGTLYKYLLYIREKICKLTEDSDDDVVDYASDVTEHIDNVLKKLTNQ